MAIRAECLKPAAEGWEPPTPEEIRGVLNRIATRRGVEKFSGGMAAKFLGLGDKGDRAVRRWIGGNSEIPYAAWALLCSEAGLGEIWKREGEGRNARQEDFSG